jgi:hypothetical protein
VPGTGERLNWFAGLATAPPSTPHDRGDGDDWLYLVGTWGEGLGTKQVGCFKIIFSRLFVRLFEFSEGLAWHTRARQAPAVACPRDVGWGLVVC